MPVGTAPMSLTELLAWAARWPSLSPDEIVRPMIACPAMIASGTIAAWREEAKHLPEEKIGLARAVLSQLDDWGEAFRKNPDKYPYGEGPIEIIAQRQRRGEISAEEALKQAQSCIKCLEPLYIEHLTIHARSIAQEGRAEEGLLYLQFLRATVGTPFLTISCVEVSSVILRQRPDAELYQQSMQIGDELRKSARDTGDCRTLGGILHALGTLHIDTYTVDADRNRYEEVMRQWAARAPADASAMPTPPEAVRRAEKYFRAAARVREGRSRGASLKALVQTLGWRGVVGLPRADAAVVRAARTALPLLDVNGDANAFFFLMTVLSDFGQPIDPEVVNRLAAVSPDTQVWRLGSPQAMNLALNLINVQARSNPQAALGMVVRSQPLFTRHADRNMMKLWWQSQRRVLKMAYRGPFDESTVSGPIAPIVDALAERAKREGWDGGQVAAAYLALAGRTADTNEEPLGIQLLDAAERIAPLTLAPIRDAIQVLRATLWLNVGVNEVDSQHWAAAMDAYGQALRLYAELNVDEVFTCLERINDLANRGGADGATAIATRLEVVAGPLEVRLGEAITDLLQQIYRSAIGALGVDNVDAVLFNRLASLAKGQRFGAMTASRAAARFRPDDEGRTTLESIDALLRAMPDYAPRLEIDDLLLLSPLQRASVGLAGATPTERLTNLQESYDLQLDRRLAESSGDTPARLPSIDDLRAALDDRTVLLSYYIGAVADRAALYQMLVTREDARVTMCWAGEPGERRLTKHVDRFDIPLSNVASAVLTTRRAIVEADEENSTIALREGSDFLLDKVRPLLGTYAKAGKTHLCIAPHGALHYFPFHLLDTRDWTITYLPNLQLLLTQRGQVTGRRVWDHTLTAIGVGFEDEARAIAEAFPGRSRTILGPAATEPALLGALRDSRYVHVAAHGAHNVIAPAFQCLYVTPGAGADGRLYAHELAGLDLRGVDLVTLSACETALGRFDNADNLRGLPAMLLLAGVSSIIGTLWPVESACAQRFFTRLYKMLSVDGTTKLEAFAEAQRHTRKFHSTPRDWGAFYFAGDWS